jgi:desulfoferrodoxin-like iron-binding protein
MSIMTTEITRRSLLKRVVTVTPLVVLGPTLMSTEEIMAALPGIVKRPKDPKNLTDFEKMHVPKLSLPPIAEDGAVVPAYVEVPHPMEDDHYIKNVEILFYTDPVVAKGKFHFTPINGEAFLSTQIRLGTSGEVVCISECNKHGKWIGVSSVKVTVGGC